MGEKKTEKKEVKEVVKVARITKPLVNVRVAPGGEIKYVAKKHETIKVLSVSDGWVLTTKGYIRSDLVLVEEG